MIIENQKLVSSLNKIQWVLVGLSHPGNFGAILRALKNMGCSPPVLASPKKDLKLDCEEALVRSGHAQDYLKRVSTGKLTDILGSSHNVIGFSARKRELDIPEVNFELIIDEISTNLLIKEKAKTSFVFGGERSGLSNKDLSRCTAMCSLDTAENYPSMNISHSLVVVAYAVRSALKNKIFNNGNIEYPVKKTLKSIASQTLACQKTLNSLEAVMVALSDSIGFSKRGNLEQTQLRLRRAIINKKMNENEANLLISFFSEISKRLN